MPGSTTNQREAPLSVASVTLRFGGLTALEDVSLTIAEREARAIIGPNGAGKTSLFNVSTGLYKPQSGTAMFAGVDLLGTRGSRLTSVGVSRTFQEVALFKGLSALENVMVGAFSRERGGWLRCGLRTPTARATERRSREEALGILDHLGLGHVADARPGELSYGTLKRLELARALAARPRLLLLDEPAGLAHAVAKALPEKSPQATVAALGKNGVEANNAVLLGYANAELSLRAISIAKELSRVGIARAAKELPSAPPGMFAGGVRLGTKVGQSAVSQYAISQWDPAVKQFTDQGVAVSVR